MSERRPDPPDPRASLVDSGWSDAALGPERELPAYEDTAREALVTRVDDQIQARIAAMNSDDRTEVASSPFTSRPKTPSPSRPKTPPPSRPQASPSRPQASPSRPQASPARPHTTPARLPPPSRPPPPPLPPSLPPLPPSARRPSTPPMPVMPQPSPLPELASAPTDERTLVDSLPHGDLPPSNPPAVQPLKPGSLPPPSMPPPKLGSLPPPASPSFAPLHSATAVAPFVPAPTLREALRERVRLGSSEIPLWGVLAPALGLTALLSALLAGVFAPSSSPPLRAGTAEAVAVDGPSASTAPMPSAPGGAETSSPRSGSPLDQARAGDVKALSAIERQRPQERSAEEALALASGRSAQTLAAAGKLRARLAADPGLARDPKVLADLRKFAQDPATNRDALAAMAALPGSLSADLLYEAWTSTAERSETTELAQALLMSRDVRPKASPALAIALDLREAEGCEDNAKILTRAIEVGDKRAYAPMSRLLRRNGCGPTKRDDCYACLREGDLLKQALTAVKARREPELVRRDSPK